MDVQAEALKNVTSEKNSMDDVGLRPYASSPCYRHELDPLFQEQVHGGDRAAIRRWRVQQRKRLLDRRKSLDGSELGQAGTEIIRALEKEPRFVGDSVAFYWPLDGEVDLRPFMHTLLSRDVDVALPVIVSENSPLEFWVWNESTAMQAHAVWNIPVPAERNVITPEVVFIPLLGFDGRGHRLGHGGGYYDRTLSDLLPRSLKVGIGYEFSRLTSIYPQNHDIPMDVIITERGSTWHHR